ncbi:hypothetical protein HH310_28805 [Actinoplanes sp. TBRC 11911]|uniref:hypothetical protein n=1 Tax=Actinoplanes sp. TBRC 11911 TaxID=2729386 RepID=UPI00145E82B5|nr:hypothetical protein [Actinoplanes sp. TBRC 11911]NMO55172.1 hypothetical protein [Actinoplanes sp. TBRC 11911]
MPVRVFVMGLTQMLSEVVRAVVASRSTLVLVGESPVTDFERAAASRADVVVAPLHRFTDGDLSAFQSTHCRVRVVRLADDARNAVLHEMRPHQTPLSDLGTETLAAVLVGD